MGCEHEWKIKCIRCGKTLTSNEVSEELERKESEEPRWIHEFRCADAKVGQPRVCEECCGCFHKDPCKMCPKPQLGEGY